MNRGKKPYSMIETCQSVPIRAKAETSKQAIIIGGGLLGLEAGHSLLQQGLDVTVLDRDPYLLPRQLDREGGELLGNLLESKGYRFILPAQTTAVNDLLQTSNPDICAAGNLIEHSASMSCTIPRNCYALNLKKVDYKNQKAPTREPFMYYHMECL